MEPIQANVDKDVDLDLYWEENPDDAELKTDAEILMSQRRTSGFIISLRWKWVVHGKYSVNDPTPASLLVFHVKLTNQTNSTIRRFKHFNLRLQFENAPKRKPINDPYITECAPAMKGSVSIGETTEDKSNNLVREAGVKGGVEYAKVSAKVKSEEGTEKQVKFDMRLENEKECSTFGKGRRGEDIVSWNLRENPSQKRGVCDSFGVAILIKRSATFPRDKFVVTSTMKATIDFRQAISEAMSDVFKGDREQPFEFDPAATAAKIPPGLNIEALADFVDSGEFEKLAWFHIPELQEPRLFYKQPESGSKDGPGGPGDAQS
jgi:hypothetical protein